MDRVRFVVESHLREGRPLAQLAQAHGVSRSWAYKVLKRYEREGDSGLSKRSRRPIRSPSKIRHRFEDDIVRLRKELLDAGYDAGADAIRVHLARAFPDPPSRSTIYRVLRARGFVIPQPHKRPRTSWHRFCDPDPNGCWQTDVTHVALADGTKVEVLNFIDDHSRLCVASRVFATVRSADVIRTFHRAGAELGYPAAVQSDNGLVFAGRPVGSLAALEVDLLSLGIAIKHSRPGHPECNGKVERFHQTLKRHLAAQPTAETKRQLQGQLDRFHRYYNEVLPIESMTTSPRPRSIDYEQRPPLEDRRSR
jgi:transposase InsO family protein